MSRLRCLQKIFQSCGNIRTKILNKIAKNLQHWACSSESQVMWQKSKQWSTLMIMSLEMTRVLTMFDDRDQEIILLQLQCLVICRDCSVWPIAECCGQGTTLCSSGWSGADPARYLAPITPPEQHQSWDSSQTVRSTSLTTCHQTRDYSSELIKFIRGEWRKVVSV